MWIELSLQGNYKWLNILPVIYMKEQTLIPFSELDLRVSRTSQRRVSSVCSILRLLKKIFGNFMR